MRRATTTILAILLQALAAAGTGCAGGPGGSLLGPGWEEPGDGGLPPEEVPAAEPTPEPQGLCHVELDCTAMVRDEPKVPCRLLVAGADGRTLYFGWAGVELRGRSSLGFPKHQYNVELWEDGRVLVSLGWLWRFRDSGVAPPSDWTSPGFDDSSWPESVAPLGWGSGEATTVSWGGDPQARNPTTWFRHTFDVADTQASGPLTIGLRRDAGAVVYLNGTEVLRTNMPGGPVGPETLALEPQAGTACTRYFRAEVDPGLLAVGTNVVAVELHLADRASGSAVFDLWMGDVGDRMAPDLFGMGGDSDWILGGNYADRALFRNKLSFDLYQAFGGVERYATQTVLCEAAIDGTWQGVFTWGERIKRDDDRVVLQEDPTGQGGSFIAKTDDGAGALLGSPSTYGGWFPVYPAPEEIGAASREGIADRIGALEMAAIGPDPGDPDSGIFSVLDISSAVDWVLIQELSKNNDAYFLSIYAAQDLGGPVFLLPWDHDLAWGGYPVDNCGPEGWVAYRAPLVAAMAGVPEFRERLAMRWWELRAGPLSEENLLASVQRYEDTIGTAAYDNFEVWPMEEINFTWDNVNWLCPVASWDEEMVHIRTWIHDRLEWIDANIEAY